MNKLYKKIGAMILTVSLLLTLAVNTTAATTFQTARQAVDSIKVGWNLGNTMDAYGNWFDTNTITNFESSWGNPVTTQAMINSVKAQGFNAIRIPITWSQHIDKNGNVDSKWMARVKTVVDYAYNNGMYVIINVHHDNGPSNGGYAWMFADKTNFTNNQAKFKGLWTNIANQFKDYGDHLLFEGYNEVIDTSDTWNKPSNGSNSYSAINSYAQLFVSTVRATGGNNAQRNLIINTYVASHEQECLNNLTIPTDTAKNHLMVEVHVYHPWEFTGTPADVNWTTTHTDFRQSDKDQIDTIMTRLKSFSDSKGVPVIIGEFGAEYKKNDAEIAKYAKYFVDAAGKRGIKCFYWDNGDEHYNTSTDGYAIFKRSTLTWKTGISSAMVSAAAPYVKNTASPTPADKIPTPAHTHNYINNYCSCGKIANVTSLAKINGQWVYVKDGQICKETTLVKYNNGWWYVKDGVLCNDETLVKYNNAWWYVKDGKLCKDITLVKYNNAYWYVKDGKMCKDETLVKYNNAWWYVKDGKLCKTENFVSYSNSLWYCKDGKMQSSFTGQVTINGSTRYVSNGKVM